MTVLPDKPLAPSPAAKFRMFDMVLFSVCAMLLLSQLT